MKLIANPETRKRGAGGAPLLYLILQQSEKNNDNQYELNNRSQKGFRDPNERDYVREHQERPFHACLLCFTNDWVT
jgi:hypothetical protein